MKELHDNTIKLFDELMQKHRCAMAYCQSWGFNGFKRWHRRRSKKFLCLAIGIMNDLFDRHWEVAETAISPAPYHATDLINHLEKWAGVLDKALAFLATLNKKYFDANGTENRLVKEAIHRLMKDREKARRWHKRFLFTKSEHDMHVLDDKLYRHEKRREKKER